MRKWQTGEWRPTAKRKLIKKYFPMAEGLGKEVGKGIIKYLLGIRENDILTKTIKHGKS